MSKIVLRFILILLIIFSNHFLAKSQNTDSLMIRKIYDTALEQGACYDNLYDLCTTIGHRLSGSQGAEKAVIWAKTKLEQMGLDTVYLQEFMAPNWKRGNIERAFLLSENNKRTELTISALGHSVATPPNGLTAQVVEVTSWEQLDKMGTDLLGGKIVFFNRPADAKLINTFHSYGGCVDQRVWGASRAGKYGAVAVLTRSATVTVHKHAHTGVMVYEEGVEKIPAAALSPKDADLLSRTLLKYPETQVHLNLDCEMKGQAVSHNVIGEIRGSKYPDEIILIGGHLDSWDVGQGAHDDGAGCVHSMEVLHIFKQMNLNPERTLRCVLFMNEENGVKGAEKYALDAKANNEKHIVAIESDRGGFTPRGFDVAGNDEVKETAYSQLLQWKNLFEPYGVHHFKYGYGGVDINKLQDQGTALFGFVPDSQRYFDHHHTHNDTIDAVNKRELELGSASITALVYLFSKYGLQNPF